ncbi:hypothetical protein CRUP_025056, partial [Coryphaenoides rupestris]
SFTEIQLIKNGCAENQAACKATRGHWTTFVHIMQEHLLQQRRTGAHHRDSSEKDGLLQNSNRKFEAMAVVLQQTLA